MIFISKLMIGNMYRYIPVLPAALFLLSAASCTSAAGSLAEQLPMEVVYQAKAPIVIAVSSTASQVAMELPSAPARPGKVLCLRFRALYPVDNYVRQLANYYLKIEVNGKTLDGLMPDESDRLLNRGRIVHNIDGRFPWWDSGALSIYFGHETGEMDPRVIEPRDQDYWYVINISDAGEYSTTGADNRPVGGKPNKIIFKSLRLDPDPKPIPSELRIENLSMGYLPKETVDKLVPMVTVSYPRLTGKQISADGCALTVSPSGAMELKSGSKDYAFRSSFSYPSDQMKYHQFTWADGKDYGWKTGYLPSGKNGISIKGECARFSVLRSVVSRQGKFYVKDTIQNKTGDAIGMSIHNEVVSGERIPSADEYLSGANNLREDDKCGYNPTVFMSRGSASLGVVVEDTVFSYQLSMMKKVNSVQFGTEHFGLEPHKSYTLEWTIYPAKSKDYFDFINRLRNDWHVNYTIPGQFTAEGLYGPDSVDHPSPEMGMTYYALSPWYLFMEGDMPEQDYLNLMKQKVRDLLKAEPTAVPMTMLETSTVGVLRKDIPGGSKIPKEPVTFDCPLNEEQAQVLRSSPWWDSMLKTKDGLPMVDTYYTDKDRDDFNLNVYPVIGNYQYKYMIHQIDKAMDEAGCKGVYMDNFEPGESIDGEGYRMDYGQWDGHTVKLDSKGEIAAKCTDASLASVPARVAILKHIREKGGWPPYANGHPVARELRAIPYVTFAETEWEHVGDYDGLQRLLSPEKPWANSHMAMGHLSTPVSMGIELSRKDLFFTPPTPADFGVNHAAEIVQKYVIACLRNGQLFFPYAEIPVSGPGKGEYGIIREMFPFTPVELHEGYLIGKERIVTAVSGTFYWNVSDHPSQPGMCKAFDVRGYQIAPKTYEVTRVGNRWKIRLELQSDWNGTAVIF